MANGPENKNILLLLLDFIRKIIESRGELLLQGAWGQWPGSPVAGASGQMRKGNQSNGSTKVS